MHLDLLRIPQSGGKNVKTFRWDQSLKLFLTFSAVVANPARDLLNREKNKKKKSLAAPFPPPPPPARCSFGENKIKNEKITRRIHMSRRYAGRRYAGGLGPSRVRRVGLRDSSEESLRSLIQVCNKISDQIYPDLLLVHIKL